MHLATEVSGNSPVSNIYLILTILVLGSGILGVSIANFRNKNKQQDETNWKQAYDGSQALVVVLREQNDQYRADIKGLQGKYEGSQKEIGRISGELKSFRDLPLERMAVAIETIVHNQIVLAKYLPVNADIIKELKNVVSTDMIRKVKQ